MAALGSSTDEIHWNLFKKNISYALMGCTGDARAGRLYGGSFSELPAFDFHNCRETARRRKLVAGYCYQLSLM